MTPGFSTRRRAERFHEALQGVAVDSPDVAWVDLVDRLRATAPVEPRAAFVADLRERLLVAAADELPLVAPNLRIDPASERLRLAPGRSRRERRLAAGIGALALVGAGTSMAVAAQGALPGDTLYPLKRAIENVQVGVEQEPDDRGAALLEIAAGRLEEVSALVSSDEQDEQVTVATLDDFADQAAQASDLLMASYEGGGPTADVETVHDFAQSSMDTIQALQEDVPPGPTLDALYTAAGVVATIDDAASRLCPACGDPLVLPYLALDPGALESARRIEVPPARPRTGPATDPAAPHAGRPGRDTGGGSTGPVAVEVADPRDGTDRGGTSPDGTSPDGTGPGETTTDPGTPSAPDASGLPGTDEPASDPYETLTNGLGDLTTGAGGTGSAGGGQQTSGSGSGGASGGGSGGASNLEETVEDVAGDLLP